MYVYIYIYIYIYTLTSAHRCPGPSRASDPHAEYIVVYYSIL